MDTNPLSAWLAVLNPLIAALLILGNDRLKWLSSVRRARRKLALWNYLRGLAPNHLADEAKIFQDCAAEIGDEATLQALLYEMLCEGMIERSRVTNSYRAAAAEGLTPTPRGMKLDPYG